MIKDAKLGELREVFTPSVSFWVDRLKALNDESIFLFAEMIAQSEKAKQVLRDKGYGWTGLSLLETIEKEVPHAI